VGVDTCAGEMVRVARADPGARLFTSPVSPAPATVTDSFRTRMIAACCRPVHRAPVPPLLAERREAGILAVARWGASRWIPGDHPCPRAATPRRALGTAAAFGSAGPRCPLVPSPRRPCNRPAAGRRWGAPSRVHYPLRCGDQRPVRGV